MVHLDPSALRFSALRQRIREHRLGDPLAWRDRAVMWGAAALAGLCVVGFSMLTDEAAAFFKRASHAAGWLPFVLTPAGLMLVAWATRRFAPGAAGSGIPQVMVGLNPGLPAHGIRDFVSVKLSFFKAFLGSVALACGASAGREGPSVQIAAGIMLGCRRGFSHLSRITPQELMLAGGSAGIAAAFNAPLAGVVFAIEELSRRFEQRASGVVVTAIVLSGLVSISVLGNYTYFGQIKVDALPHGLFLPAAVCALLAGLLGGLFSRLLILSVHGSPDRFSQFRRKHPVWFAGFCGLMIAALGVASGGAAFGSGYQYTFDVLHGREVLPAIFVGIKFLATWFTYWAGVPGGIFAPALSVGAGLGNDVALLMNFDPAPLIALGMVGFLAAATQAPVTSFIIVMEMIGGHTMVLSLMATALVASLVSRMVSPPLYHSLAELQFGAWQQAHAAQAAPEAPAESEAASAPPETRPAP